MHKSIFYIIKKWYMSNKTVKVCNFHTSSRFIFLSHDRNFQYGGLHDHHFELLKPSYLPYFKSDFHEIFNKLNVLSSSTMSSQFIIKWVFSFNIENGILCLLIRIASMRRFQREYTTYRHVKENRQYFPIMPLVLALCLTLLSSNYPCLEHIFMVPKVFEPLRFHCICRGQSIENMFDCYNRTTQWKNRYNFQKILDYSRTSMARTPSEPWKYVLDRGSSS